MPTDPHSDQNLYEHTVPSGLSVQDIQARAKAKLRAQLDRVSARHPRYDAHLENLSFGHSSGDVRIAISGAGIWDAVAPTRAALRERIEESLHAKYGGGFDVRVEEGSIEITIIWSAIETARYAYELVSSCATIVEYIIRCVEQERMEWPPIASMFTFFEALKKFFMGF